MTKRLWKSGGVAIAASLMLSLMAPIASAAPVDDSTPFTPQIQDTPQATGFGTFNRLPDVEPGVVGEIPASGSGLNVAGLSNGSALVRLSAFAGDSPVQVSAAGAPVLQVLAGSESSTTILVPVQNGQIPVTTTADAKVRVEVLASFAADAQTPGATLALPEAVKRADSANDLGLQSLSSTSQDLSVVGIGGVPSQNVRAVYVTANIQLENAGTVTLAGQELELPAGQSIITTIAVVSEDGAIELSSSVAGDIRVDVTGWVVGAAQNMSSANATGSYVPAADAQWTTSQVSPEAATSVEVTGYSGRQQAVALVSAEVSEGATRSFVNVGDEAKGRARGILVDPEHGALPQIELVEVSAAEAAVSVQGSAVDVNVLALGDIVGEAVSGSGHTEVQIQAPETVDLQTEGEILLRGSIISDAPVDKVDLFGNDQYIGTASVNYTASGATWSFHTAAPEAGDAKFTAKAVARDGSTSDVSTEVTVSIPEEDVTVIAPEVVILETEELNGYTEGTFSFSTEPELAPGDVLVADASEATPEGALGRVTSIQQTADGWVVQTEEATLTDVFLQAETESFKPAFTEGTELIVPEANEGYEVIDEGVPNAELITVENDAATHNRFLRSAESNYEDAFEAELKLSGKAELAFTSEKKTDLSFATEGTKERIIDEVKTSGGITFEGTLEATLGIETVLDIDITWSWGIPKGELSHFKSVFKGGFKAGYEASVSGTYTENVSYKIAELKGSPITIMVGPVPVVFIPGATVSAIGEIKSEVSFSYGDDFNPTFEYGVEFKDGTWNPVRSPDQGAPEEASQCVGWGSNVKVSGSIAGKGGLELAADVKLFGFAGPKAVVTAEGKSDFTIEYDGATDELSATTTRALVLAGALKIDAKFKVIGIEIGDEWEMARIERSFTITDSLPIQLDLCADGPPPPSPEDGEEAADSILTGTVLDASTGDPLPDVALYFKDGQGQEHNISSDEYGNYDVTLAYGRVFVSVNAEGYIPYSRTVTVPEGETKSLDIQLSPELESTQYRAVLTWGAQPSDLDSHLIGVDQGQNYHVYYGDKRAYGADSDDLIAELDVDDVTAYGPETTTFDVTSTGDYTFFIHNYSQSPSLAGSGANVALYAGNSKIADFDVPAGGEQLYWNVFRVKNGQLIILNNLTDSPSVSADTTVSRRMADPGKITDELLDQAHQEIETSEK